jgi:hypothetical protein
MNPPKRIEKKQFKTGASVSKIKRKLPCMGKLIQYLCGVFVGHEPSKTDWGYGGGKNCDVWCRWCDKMFQIPLEQAVFLFPGIREMRPQDILRRAGPPIK